MRGNDETGKTPARAGKRRMLLSETMPFVITEAYKTARTNLMFSLATSERKIVIITSSNPSEGKSTTCSNLGLTFAGMGAHTLIIDADLRKPTVHKMFGLQNKKGLSTILSSFSKIDESICYGVAENLDIITAGPIPPNPADLLASDSMDSLLKALAKHYDYILIDTPPINVVTDSQLMNNIVSGIMFVVWEGGTTYTDIKTALRSIEMAKGKVLGLIKVNCNAKNARSYRKNYKYKYEYGRKPKNRKSRSPFNKQQSGNE